jgi:hypothetical protein
MRKIQEKMTKRIMILTKLSTFIWKAIFRKTRVLYIFVVRSTLIYDVFVWHMVKNKKSRSINKLAILQNRCLRSIFEVCKIISIFVLKVKTHVALIDLHLNHLQTQMQYRMKITNISSVVRRECKFITSKLSNDSERSRMHKFISKELKHKWVSRQLIEKQKYLTITRFLSERSLSWSITTRNCSTIEEKTRWIAFTSIAERRNELRMCSSCRLQSRRKSITSTEKDLSSTINWRRSKAF